MKVTRLAARCFGWINLGICLGILAAGLTACELPSTELPEPTPSPSQSVEPDWITVYFTDPDDPRAESFRGGPDAQLAEAIGQARASVDAALYDLNLWSIRDALIAAHRRGVTVRVVTESDNLDEREIQQVKEAGIPVLGDRREGLMHNKFVVIDRQEVWTGSMNFTTTDAYLNNNHLVRIRSTELAENFVVEFNEMFVDDLFGPDRRSVTPNPMIQIESSTLQTSFSPDDGTARLLIEWIASAKESINFLAFSFTSDELGDVVIEQAKTGVQVAGVFEDAQITSNIGSEYERLVGAGLDIRRDGNLHNMHHKVFIIDQRWVVMGSYNFSNSAETRNDENTLILDNVWVASQFVLEFEKIYQEARR
jgi:phosphatidylserine/phosphatidylglycerophosphate/cardiolipin synthase-like enzyme